MNTTLKLLIIGGFILVQLSYKASSQKANPQLSQKELKKRWETLKSDLSKRNLLMVSFLAKLRDSLNELKTQIAAHNKYIHQSKVIDSITMQTLSQQSDTLEGKYLLFEKLLKDKEYLIKPKVANAFLNKLKKIEDQLFMSKQNYNDMCDANHELYFQPAPKSSFIYPM